MANSWFVADDGFLPTESKVMSTFDFFSRSSAIDILFLTIGGLTAQFSGATRGKC